MKTALPLDENKTDVCQAFARAPFIMFSDDGDIKIVPNPAADAEGGAGLKATQFLLDSGIDALITFRCGENAGKALKAAECKIYKAQNVSAEENLKLCAEGKLAQLDHFHAGYHGIH